MVPRSPDAGLPARDGLPLRLLLVLALLSATAPLSVDFYLASFPAIATSLETDAGAVQLTLTAFLVGLGVGQVLWGPVTDHLGRVRPLLVGCTVSTLAAAVAVLAPTIEVLIGARFVQALAGAAGIVVARAVIADLLEGFAAARAMSLMMTIKSIAPVAAPAIGGAVAGHVPWRGVLGIVLAVTVLQLVGALTTVRESLPPQRRTPRVQYASLGRLFGRPAFLGYAATVLFTFGALMTYISSSSFVYQGVLGTTELVYGLLFALNAIGLTIGGLVSARLARRRVHPARTVSLALPVTVASTAAVLVVAVSPLPAWVLAMPLFPMVTSAGFVMGNTSALALQQSRDVAGAGSALVGGLMFLFGGVVSPLGGIAGDDTAVPMALVMVVSSACALGSFVLTRRYVRGHPAAERAFTAEVVTADR